LSGETVTDRNRRNLREAAERLLGGRAHSSDGKLTIKSLAVEAGLPRAYLYRDAYRDEVERFEVAANRMRASGKTPDANLAEIARLQAELVKVTDRGRKHWAEARRARDDLKVAASQIAYLHAQNDALRRQLSRAAAVVPIEPHL